MIGVTEMTIVNWEKGRTKPAKEYLERLKKILGDLGRFVKGIDA